MKVALTAMRNFRDKLHRSRKVSPWNWAQSQLQGAIFTMDRHIGLIRGYFPALHRRHPENCRILCEVPNR
jgi:hypothetical protein